MRLFENRASLQQCRFERTCVQIPVAKVVRQERLHGSRQIRVNGLLKGRVRIGLDRINGFVLNSALCVNVAMCTFALTLGS